MDINPLSHVLGVFFFANITLIEENLIPSNCWIVVQEIFFVNFQRTFTHINLIVCHKINFIETTTNFWNQYLDVILLLNKGSIKSHIMTNDNLFPTFLEMTAMFLWRRLQRNQITKSRISGPAEFILCHCFWTPRVPGISNNFSKIITKKGQWLKCLLKISLEVDSYQYI